MQRCGDQSVWVRKGVYLLDRDYQNTTQIYYNLVLKQTYTIALYLITIANKKLEGNFYLYIVKEIFDGVQT